MNPPMLGLQPNLPNCRTAKVAQTAAIPSERERERGFRLPEIVGRIPESDVFP
ncbi:hypothetical protein HMPREF9123_2148 [Neisseria bacilliformis ATCC BAA-1200]|uniref:Uncharacterized protein n=1 Tax=Neisseria bacilliformis ATCC BAA-1200 TaxID=888742 RepID=F2BEJ2_9NEIS|nr:hypothetical protein HMPREF9123_2148 [Neisseria bacilliformis ATCC BAA-1200]